MQRRRGCGAELTAHLAAFGAILRTLLSHYAPEISPLLLLAMDRLWLEALIMAANECPAFSSGACICRPLSFASPVFAEQRWSLASRARLDATSGARCYVSG